MSQLTVLAIPEQTVDRLRSGSLIDGLHFTPLTKDSIPNLEMARLLGPLSEYDSFDDNPNFERWVAKPDGLTKNVLVWSLKKDHAQNKRLLKQGEHLILVSGAYSKQDYDEASAKSLQATTDRLLALGGRDVTKRCSLIARFMESLFGISDQ